MREGFYQCRRFEATNLWRRSFLLSIFLVFCFAVYGALASEILTAGPGAANFLALNEAACAVALLGTSFALIWIMMAKGSKAWYEVYERYIFEIEQEEAEGLKIPERYRLGLVPPLGDERQPLFEEGGPLLPLAAQHHDRVGDADGLADRRTHPLCRQCHPLRRRPCPLLAAADPRAHPRLVPRRSRHGGSQHVGPEPVAGEALTPDFRK